jgi:aldehyde oxidoreductase
MEQLDFILNDKPIQVQIDPSESLLEVIRNRIGLTGTKQGCGKGDCGACSVIVDGIVINSCIYPAMKTYRRRVTTIEGIGTFNNPHPIQEAFADVGAVQCGYCTPGMVISAKSLLDRNPSPSSDEIKEALSGNLCRCTGYVKVIEGVQRAAEIIKGKTFPKEKLADALGARLGRLEGLEKAVGATQYGIDLTKRGILSVKVLRSPHYHARIKRIDTAQAERLEGVVCVITAKDIPGQNRVGTVFKNRPILVRDKVKCIGDPIAAVAAISDELAEEAIRRIHVDYEILEPVLDPFFGMEERSPKVHEDNVDSNLFLTRKILKGDAERALLESDVLSEGTFTTPFVEHACLELEAGIAYMDEQDRVVIHSCCQDTHFVQSELANVLALPADRIRVIQAPTGGGFGGKIDIHVQGVLAVLALKLRKEVKWVYSREESFSGSSKRHPFYIRCRAGATHGGKLTAVDHEVVGDKGAYGSFGSVAILRAGINCTGPYYFPHVRYVGKLVYTNNPYAGAMRGFGVPQIAIAVETQMDILAERLRIDPLLFRMQNALEPGKDLATGKGLAASVGIKACFQALKDFYAMERESIRKVNEKRIREGSPKRQGIGVAGVIYGCGKAGISDPSEARVELEKKGKVIIYTGACDIGQGSTTTFAQLAASEFGLSMKWIEVVSADTDLTPNSGTTCASRQTYISGNAVRMAASRLKRAMIEAAAMKLGDKIENVRIGDGFIYSNKSLDNWVGLDEVYYLMGREGVPTTYNAFFDPRVIKLDENGQGFPMSTYAFGAQVAVAEVDIETGGIRVLKVGAAHDVGRAINPSSIEGQIHGGILMGLGFALQEEFIPGVTKNFKSYAIPTVRDMPEIITLIIEDPEPTGPFGAKGVGEPTLVPTAPAIINAVYHATGARIYDLPLTPARVVKALKREVRGSAVI